MQLIRILADAYPATVSRAQLLDELWPNQIISDSSLSQLIRRTRVLLGDSGQTPIYIKTVHGTGARFLVDPSAMPGSQKTSAAPPSSNAKPRSRFAASILILILVFVLGAAWYFWQTAQHAPNLMKETPTVALLPIQNSTKDDQFQWVQLGLTDMLGRQLESTKLLHVVDTETMAKLAKQQPDANPWEDSSAFARNYENLCGDLGCDYLVAARLEQQGDRMRISYVLANAEGLHPVRSVEGNDTMEAGLRLAKQLIETIAPSHPWTMDFRAYYSDNPAANQSFAMGIQALFEGTPLLAEKYFKLALELEPNFDWATLYLADALSRLGEAQKANQLLTEILAHENLADPVRNKAIYVQTGVLYGLGQLQESLDLTLSLLAKTDSSKQPLEYADALFWAASVDQALNHLDDATSYLEQAKQIYLERGFKPGLAHCEFLMANLQFRQMILVDALTSIQHAQSLYIKLRHKRALAHAHLTEGVILLAMGETSKARQALMQAKEAYDSKDQEGLYYVRLYQAEADLEDKKLDAAISQLNKLHQELEPTDLGYHKSLAHMFLARAYLNTDDLEQAETYIANASEFFPYRPTYLLLPAHLKYLRKQIAEAVQAADEAKVAAPAWSANAARVTNAYRTALETGNWMPVNL